jgi:hypothetical protein
VVLDVVATRQADQSRPETDQRVRQNDDLLYIATDFGIAIYDLERLEFNDTYFIGDNAIELRVKSWRFFRGSYTLPL